MTELGANNISYPLLANLLLALAAGKGDTGVAELPNLMPPRSARLPLDTKHSRENTKLLGSVEHTRGENPKILIFAIRITNERIKLTSFLVISYITLHVYQSITFIFITAECNHIIRVMNNLMYSGI